MSQTMIVRPTILDAAERILDVRRGAVRWRCRPEFRDFLESGPIDWHALDSAAGVELMKSNAQRSVYRLLRGKTDWFVKVYRARGVGPQLKLLLRGPTAAQEWTVGEYAAEYGVPAVRPIACGWLHAQRRTGPSWLITETVRDARPLAEYWLDVREEPQAARLLIDVVARLVARAHQSGFHHRDMHAGNILVRRDASDAPEAFFVDLHNVEIHRRVPTPTVVANLAQLNQWFRRHATRTQRLAFLNRYLRYRDQFASVSRYARNWQADRRKLLADLDRRATLHAERLWAKRDRRSQRDGRYFCKLIPARGWRGLALCQAKHPRPGSRLESLTLERAAWHEVLSQPYDWIRPDRAEVVKDSHTAGVFRGTMQVCRDQAGEQSLPVYVKQPRPRTWLKRLGLWLGHSRNLRTWRIANKLIHRDLLAAQPLAVVERFAAGLFRTDSLLISEAVDSAGDLEAYLAQHVAALPPCERRAAKLALQAALIRFLRDFCGRGFVHRDLKATNILVCPSPAARRPVCSPLKAEGDQGGSLRGWGEGDSRTRAASAMAQTPCGKQAGVAAPCTLRETHPANWPQLVLIDLDGVSHRPRLRHADHRLRSLARLAASLAHVTGLTRTDRVRFLRAYMCEPGRSSRDWRILWRDLAARAGDILDHKARRREWKLRHYGRE